VLGDDDGGTRGPNVCALARGRFLAERMSVECGADLRLLLGAVQLGGYR
jgi:hypothetical protein